MIDRSNIKNHEVNMKPIAKVITAVWFACVAMGAQQARAAVISMEGFSAEDRTVVEGAPLVLNGAGVRKRGYFKTEFGTLYLPAPAHTFDEVFGMPGSKRIHLVLLREFTSALAEKTFLNDFKLSATEEEYRSLLPEVSVMGKLYGSLPTVKRGDVVDVDWIPNAGIKVYLNGRALLDKPLNSERFFKVMLRNYIGSGAPTDYRKSLLGTP